MVSKEFFCPHLALFSSKCTNFLIFPSQSLCWRWADRWSGHRARHGEGERIKGHFTEKFGKKYRRTNKGGSLVCWKKEQRVL